MESDNADNLRHYTLRNGNPPGNPHLSPRCGAKTRSGAPCRAPAMWSKKAGRYTKCRKHGGASTGPRTSEGLKRVGKAHWKHGEYSKAHIAECREWRNRIRWLRLQNDLLEREGRLYLREKKRQERLAAQRAPADPEEFMIVEFQPPGDV